MTKRKIRWNLGPNVIFSSALLHALKCDFPFGKGREAGGRGRVSLSGWFHSKIMLAKSTWATCWVRIGYS